MFLARQINMKLAPVSDDCPLYDATGQLVLSHQMFSCAQDKSLYFHSVCCCWLIIHILRADLQVPRDVDKYAEHIVST